MIMIMIAVARCCLKPLALCDIPMKSTAAVLTLLTADDVHNTSEKPVHNEVITSIRIYF